MLRIQLHNEGGATKKKDDKKGKDDKKKGGAKESKKPGVLFVQFESSDVLTDL